MRCFPVLKSPEIGLVVCTRGNLYGSVCKFKCVASVFTFFTPHKIMLSNQSRENITCVNDGGYDSIGAWDMEPPTCDCEFVVAATCAATAFVTVGSATVSQLLL